MAKKIALNKQTLRVLSAEEMEVVAGGASTTDTTSTTTSAPVVTTTTMDVATEDSDLASTTGVTHSTR